MWPIERSKSHSLRSSKLSNETAIKHELRDKTYFDGKLLSVEEHWINRKKKEKYLMSSFLF